MYATLSEKKNIKLILEMNKGHNPNYTEAAVKLLGEYLTDLAKRRKQKKLESAEEKAAFLKKYDWNAMTEQDEQVWADVFECLDN